MQKVLQLLVKYIGYPLAEKVLKGTLDWAKAEIGIFLSNRAKKKVAKKKKTLIKKIEKATTYEERKKLSIELDRINNS